jgi:hypothetical protein
MHRAQTFISKAASALQETLDSLLGAPTSNGLIQLNLLGIANITHMASPATDAVGHVKVTYVAELANSDSEAALSSFQSQRNDLLQWIALDDLSHFVASADDRAIVAQFIQNINVPLLPTGIISLEFERL